MNQKVPYKRRANDIHYVLQEKVTFLLGKNGELRGISYDKNGSESRN